MAKNRIILIFGDPSSGKSYLADELQSRYGYDVISLDESYLSFIKEQYPKLYLDSLNLVVSQHYGMVLTRLHKRGERDWIKYVVSLIKANRSPFIAVEGYLLSPILDEVQSRLSKKALVVAVYVHEQQYFSSSSIDEIHARVLTLR